MSDHDLPTRVAVIETRFDLIMRRFDDLDRRFDQMDRHLDRLETNTDTRLARMEVAMQTQASRIESRIDRLFYWFLGTAAAGFFTMAKGFRWF